MKDRTFDSCYKLTEKDWPIGSFRDFTYHKSCSLCGKDYLGPKEEIKCYVCENKNPL